MTRRQQLLGSTSPYDHQRADDHKRDRAETVVRDRGKDYSAERDRWSESGAPAVSTPQKNRQKNRRERAPPDPDLAPPENKSEQEERREREERRKQAAASAIKNLSLELGRHRILDTRSTCAFLNLSISQWRELRARGEAPAGLLLGTKKQGWPVGVLIDWLASRSQQQNEDV